MHIQTEPASIERLLALMKQGDDAFNSRDLDAMDALHDPHAVCHVTGSPEPTFTLPPHRKMIEEFIRAFPDVHVHNDPYPIQFGHGDWVTVISRNTGTFTGELYAPDGSLVPPTGGSFDVNFTTICKWGESEQLVEEWVFWDSLLLAQQVGIAG